MTLEELHDKLYRRGSGLMQEAGDDFNMSTSDFLDFLGGDVTETEWIEVGLTTQAGQSVFLNAIADTLL